MTLNRITSVLFVPGEPDPSRAADLAKITKKSFGVDFDHVDEGGVGLVRSKDPAKWFAEHLRAKKWASLWTGDSTISLVWNSSPRIFNPARSALSELRVATQFDSKVLAPMEECFAALGVTMSAYWGTVDTTIAALALLDCVPKISARPAPPPPFGLPVLQGLSGLPAPTYPVMLGWLNYWSPETCQLLGFPNPTLDASLLARSRQLPKGGWLVRITDEPLDPAGNPDHVRVLHELYARFPAIGGRDHPGVTLRG